MIQVSINPDEDSIFDEVSKITNINKLWIFSDEGKYLGVVNIETQENNRLLIKLILHGEVDIDIDAFGLVMKDESGIELDDGTRKMISERHNYYTFRHDGILDEEWQKMIHGG